MVEHSAFWGIPDFGETIRRERALRLARRSGARFVLIAGQSGCGKTIAAAQLVSLLDVPVLWLSLGGGEVSAASVLRELLLFVVGPQLDADAVAPRSERDLLDALRILARDSNSSGAAIVLDDLASSNGLLAGQMRDLHDLISPLGYRLLVTTCDAAAVRSPCMADSVVLTEAHLAVTWSECSQLAEQYGCDQASAKRELEAAGGHMAMLCILLEAAAHGSGSDCLHEPSISALLRRAGGRVLGTLDELELFSLALLGQGDGRDLARVGVVDPEALMNTVGQMPLVRVFATGGGLPGLFRVHSLAERCLLEGLPASQRARDADLLFDICEVLASKGEYRRVGYLMTQYADGLVRARLALSHAEPMIRHKAIVPLLEALESLEIQMMMSEPRLLRYCAECLLLSGRPSEAAAKARAAIRLTQYSGDDAATHLDSLVILSESLKRMDCFRECEEVADQLTILLNAAGHSRSVRFRGALSVASIRGNAGRLMDASAIIGSLDVLRSEGLLSDHDECMLLQYEAILSALRDGDFVGSASRFGVALPGLSEWLSERVMIRGNLALALTELGRAGRALPLARYAATAGDAYMASAFRIVVVGALAALGRCDDALDTATDALEVSLEAGCEYDLAVNRILVAPILRACSQLDDALCQAERAYERLCVINYMGYRPLAALEVAASLLSLGDVEAARRWVANVEAEGFGQNRYHALRASMILAECDRLEGDVAAGVDRLALHRDHILSESSNWQMAMYCRAFPGLLGMLAAAVGASRLPVHMLRMVLPEYAERGLRGARPWLDLDEWRVLGRRVLGEAGFEMLERRNGEPICRVRLFGGLDVSVGDRMVTSRDWRKSKARLLFAMLVALRGREVPREQVFEYLWPDLPEDRARNNYYVAWSAMKLALMGQTSRSTKCPYVDNKGGRLRVASDVLRSDIDEFEEALEQARDADSAGDADTALAAYVRLSTVYRGDLLPGDVYDDWFAPLRDHYQREFIDAMTRAAELLLDRDDPCEALAFVRRALSVDPLREDAYQTALRCHIAAGQRSGAIETFLQCRGRLSEDLGLDPSAETMALYQEILVMEECPRYDDYGLS